MDKKKGQHFEIVVWTMFLFLNKKTFLLDSFLSADKKKILATIYEYLAHLLLANKVDASLRLFTIPKISDEVIFETSLCLDRQYLRE